MPKTYTFVLVHGAWHTGEHWGPVADALRSAGHTVHTPTVLGFGDSRADVSHAAGVESIAQYIADNNVDDFILVGHSFGGTVIAKIAEIVPERIRRLVFWNAFVLLDGNSIVDESPDFYREMIANLGAEGMFSLPWPVWREAFLNDADHDTALRAFETLCPTPITMLEDRLDLAKFHDLVASGQVRSSYLNGLDDTAMPHGDYAWHPRFSSRLGLSRLVQMPGGHEMVFTNPAGLAEKLVEAGRD